MRLGALTALLLLNGACNDDGGPAGFPVQLVAGDHLVVQTIRTDDPPESNPATIAAARLSGDQLDLDVRYSGGCRTHRFGAFTDGKQGLSNPPFITLYLVHDAGGDACEAAVSRTLHVDVTPLRGSSGGGQGTLLIRLVEPDGTPASVGDIVYQF